MVPGVNCALSHQPPLPETIQLQPSTHTTVAPSSGRQGSTSSQRSFVWSNSAGVAKKQGGIRPIAVGCVWRRIAAKVACTHVKVASASLLAPRQLGF